jgi:hypothetical protein
MIDGSLLQCTNLVRSHSGDSHVLLEMAVIQGGTPHNDMWMWGSTDSTDSRF